MLVSGTIQETCTIKLNHNAIIDVVVKAVNEHVLGFKDTRQYSIENGWLGCWEDDGSYHNSKIVFRRIREATSDDKAGIITVRNVIKGLNNAK